MTLQEAVSLATIGLMRENLNYYEVVAPRFHRRKKNRRYQRKWKKEANEIKRKIEEQENRIMEIRRKVDGRNTSTESM